MPKFSQKSLEKLKTCDPKLRQLFEEVIKEYDCTILCGFRGEEEQNRYFDLGMSKLNWPNSRHNSYPSKAVDVAPYPIDWNDMEKFYHFGGYVQGIAYKLDTKLRWGGDWDGDFDLKDQNFFDLVHFELKEEI